MTNLTRFLRKSHETSQKFLLLLACPSFSHVPNVSRWQGPSTRKESSCQFLMLSTVFLSFCQLYFSHLSTVFFFIILSTVFLSFCQLHISKYRNDSVYRWPLILYYIRIANCTGRKWIILICQMITTCKCFCNGLVKSCCLFKAFANIISAMASQILPCSCSSLKSLNI